MKELVLNSQNLLLRLYGGNGLIKRINYKLKIHKYYINKLFNDNTYLVDGLIKKMYSLSGIKEDLRQVGLMGLYQAALKFDRSKGVKFTTFATYYILGEIKKELRENKLIKLNTDVYKISKLIKEGSNIRDLQNMGFSKDNIYLGLTYDDTYLIKIEENKLDYLNNNSKREPFFNKIKDILPKDLYKIIKYKYLFNFSQSKISEILKCSQAKISRMENLAINILKKNLY